MSEDRRPKQGFILATKLGIAKLVEPAFVEPDRLPEAMRYLKEEVVAQLNHERKAANKGAVQAEVRSYYSEAYPVGKAPSDSSWLRAIQEKTSGYEKEVFLSELHDDGKMAQMREYVLENGKWRLKDKWPSSPQANLNSHEDFTDIVDEITDREKKSTEIVRKTKTSKDTDRFPRPLEQRLKETRVRQNPNVRVPVHQQASSADLDMQLFGVPQGFNEDTALSPLRSGMSKETERIPSLNPENDPSQSAPSLQPENPAESPMNTKYISNSASMNHINQLNDQSKPSDTERMLPVADDEPHLSAEEFELPIETDTKSDTRTEIDQTPSGRHEIVDGDEEHEETFVDLDNLLPEDAKSVELHEHHSGETTIHAMRREGRRTEKLPEPISIAPENQSEVEASFDPEEEDSTTVAPEEVHPFRTNSPDSAPLGVVDKSPSDVDLSDLAPPVPDNANEYFATREDLNAPQSGNTVQIPLSDIVERPETESDRTGKILKKEDILGKKEKSQRVNAVPEVKTEAPAISPDVTPVFSTPALGVPVDEFGGSEDETSFSDVEGGDEPVDATPAAKVSNSDLKNALMADKVSSQNSAPVRPAQDDISGLSREELVSLVGEQRDYAAQLESDADKRLSEIQEAHKTIQSLRKEKSELENKSEDVYVLESDKPAEEPDLRVLNKRVMAEQNREKVLKDANAKLTDEIAELNEKISSLNEEKSKQDKDLHELRTGYDKTLVKLHNDRLEKMEMHFVKMNEDLSQKINKRRKRSLLKFAAGAVLGLGIGAAAVFGYFPRDNMSSEEKNNYESTIAVEKSEKKSLADKLAAEESAHNETKRSVQKGKEELENDRKSFNDQKSEWEKNKDADLERRIKDKVAEFEKEKASMSDKMKEYESKVADLEKNVSTLTDDYNSFKKTAEETEAGYKAKASEYESQIESQKTELEKQKSELESAKDRIHDLEKRAGVYKTKAVYDFDKALNDLGFGQPKVRLDISNILKNALVESPYEGSEIYSQFEQLFKESNGTTTYGVKSETRAEVAARLTLAAARFEKFNDTKKITDLYNTIMKDRPANVPYDDWAESTAEQVLFRMLQERK